MVDRVQLRGDTHPTDNQFAPGSVRGHHSVVIRDGEIVESVDHAPQRITRTPAGEVRNDSNILATAHTTAGMPISGPVTDKHLVNWEGGETTVGALIHVGVLQRGPDGTIQQVPQAEAEAEQQEKQEKQQEPERSAEEQAVVDIQRDYRNSVPESLINQMTHELATTGQSNTVELVAEASGKSSEQVLQDVARIQNTFTAEALEFISKELPGYDPQDVLSFITEDKMLQNHVITTQLNGYMDGYKEAIRRYRQLRDED